VSKVPVRITRVKLLDRMLLIGPPGIGKTEIVRQLAEEEARAKGKIFVDIREATDEELDRVLAEPSRYYIYYRVIATHIFPEELSYPKARRRGTWEWVEFLPPKILRVLSLRDIEGVLFIDELTNVQRDDQMSMFFSLVQEKEAGWAIKFSKGIKIVAAGNPQEWSKLAQDLPEPLRNKLKRVRVAPPKVEEWVQYMLRKYGDAWDKTVALYLKLYPDDLMLPPPDVPLSTYPTPRSWTELAVTLHQLKQDGDPEFVEEVVAGCVGDEVATKFMALLKVTIDVNEVLKELAREPEAFEKLKTNERVLVLSSLSQRAEELMSGRYDKLIEYLATRQREFLMMLVILMKRATRLAFVKKYLPLIKDYLAEVSKYV